MLESSQAGKAVQRAMISAALCASTLFTGAQAFAQTNDPIVFSFVAVGDSRQDPKAPDPTTLLAVNPATGSGAPSTTGTLLPQDAQWLQNTKAWSRILRTVQTQKANLLFLNGDMIMGYGRAIVPTAWQSNPPTQSEVASSDLVQFYTQYAYWRGMVSHLMETGTYVLPVAGNHEVQCNSANQPAGTANCRSGKSAYVENEDAYRANMGDLINDLQTNVRFQNVVGAPARNVTGLSAATAPNSTTDTIATNQAQLSYSFDVATAGGLLHFAVINTDPVGNDSHAPTGWLSADFANAKARGAAKFFVFGHKPAFTYNYLAGTGGTVAAGGLDVDANARNAFWSVITKYKATYFTGHEHIMQIDQHADATNTYPGTPYQVLVGSGGSPFEYKLIGPCPSCVEPTFTKASDRYYAWATVRVHQSGAVSLEAYGFNDSYGPTQLLQSISNLQ